MATVVDPVLPDAARYAKDHTTPLIGTAASAAHWTSTYTQASHMMSGVPEARLLEALVVISGARRVLEIGTFTGVTTLVMAAALAPGGRVITLESDPEYVALARRHFESSPLADRIDLIAGDALASIGELEGQFDLVYIDAWKFDYPDYYDLVLPKLAARGLIVTDNVLYGGKVLDPSDGSRGAVAMREFAQQVANDDRVDNVLLTVGDGLMLAWRSPVD